MPETLPGNPTDAGPDTRNDPPMAWDDYVMFAEEELCFGRRRYRPNTKQDRAQLISAIEKAEALLERAKEAIRVR